MKKTMLVATLLVLCSIAGAADRSFGYFTGQAESLRPPSMPGDAKENRSSSQNGASVEWLAYRQQANSTNQANAIVEVQTFSGGDHNGNFKYYGVRNVQELTILNAEYQAVRRVMMELDTFRSLQRVSGKITTAVENTLPEDQYQGQYSVRNLSDFIKLRKQGKLGNYHTMSWVERVQSEHGMVYSRQVAQAGNVFVRTRTLVSKGYDGGLPATATTMNHILGKLGGQGFAPAPDEPAARAEPKEPEAVHRPELTAYPSRAGITGSRALIPASDQLPARIVLKGGKPNSTVVFHVRRDGGLLKAQGRQDRYELPVRVDAQGNAEVRFFYVGEPLTAAAEYEVIAMNEGKKATAGVVVGLGLEFSRLRAIKGQSYASSIYAFSLGVESRFHPKLEIGEYLYHAEASGAWDGRTLGIHIAPEWVNRNGGGDLAYDRTTMIKPLPGGNGLVATDNGRAAGLPYYEGAKYAYPAVKLESTGKHIYKVAGEAVVIDKSGVVTARNLGEPSMVNQALIVMTVDPGPDSYFKMLSCSLDAQDGIQWLIWEGAKSIPVAGQAFDGVQTGAGILCKLTDGDYENAFYDFANFAGGKSLEKLGVRLKENPDKYSKKVHTSYQRAQSAYDGLMAKKNDDERDRLMKKSLEKYGLAAPSIRAEDDVDPNAPEAAMKGERTPTIKSPAAPQSGGPGSAVSGNADLEKSLNELSRSVQGAEKDLRNLGEGLMKIFK